MALRKVKKKNNAFSNFPEFYDLYDEFLSKNVYIKLGSYNKIFTFFIETLDVGDKKGFVIMALQKKIEFEKNRVLFNGVVKVPFYVPLKTGDF
jgi:hypothetical protein